MASLDILLIGGSGFVSGTLARRALAAGHRVWAVTRGQRPLPEGVVPLVADRRVPGALEEAVARAALTWDLAVDCIGYDPQDARQDVEAVGTRAGHLVFISTDFVYEPGQRHFPQPEAGAAYVTEGYGGKKRQCEEVLAASQALRWTVLRPCHIYGPGSLLGCLPRHGRDPGLLERLREGQELALVGGGYFLQQPILAADLADLVLSLAGNAASYGGIFNAAGPQIVESRRYYGIIADILGVELCVKEVPVDQHLAAEPGSAPFLCHRVYALDRLEQSGASIPATSLESGLRQQVEALL